MFSRINFIHMTHEGWMKWFIIYPKLNEIISLTLTLVSTPLGGFSPFYWWPLVFHFSLVTSLLGHRHLQHVCSFPSPLLHSTHFIQCWSLYSFTCWPCHICPIVQFSSFCNIFARSLWHCLQSNFHLWSLQALSHCIMGNNLGF